MQHFRFSRGFVFLLGLLLLAACDRRVEPWVDAEDEPPPVERPVRVPGLEKPVSRIRLEPGVQSLPSAAAATSGAPIRGTLRLADGVTAPAGGIVFVIARAPGGGPPLAVLRMPVAAFPRAFSIGPEDVMIQGRPFVGPIRLSARVDADGDPLTRAPEDPSAIHPDDLEPGASGIELELRPG